ncbi:MAG: M20/M25/M40 family metallo-hydrolase [Rhizobacter sp.]|nr:M20/M25/M40 family metallo-hydrolase [Bacteriovorax sp.]
MKTKLFATTLFVSLAFSGASEAKLFNNKTMWIGIEPLVLKTITNSHMHVFDYKDVVKGNKETYFKINESELSKVSEFIHHNFKRCGGYRILPGEPKASEKLSDYKALFATSAFGWYDFQMSLTPDYSINQENMVNAWLPEISEDYMNSVVIKLSNFKTRYYKSPEGIEAFNWIADEWKRIGKDRTDIHIDLYHYATHDQPTVIATIEGSDPELKDQIIILGGHGDSINTDHEAVDSPAPGADDNAAGIAVVSEVLRNAVLQNFKPKHTIQFIAYAAEEEGIQGSHELAKVYREKKSKVLGVMQFDGVNYNIKKTFDMALISDSTNADQNNFLATLIDKYVHVKWTWDQCGYGCSDHAAWNYEGYRASFPVEAIMDEQTPYLHTANDTFDKSDNSTEHAVIFAKLGIAYLIELDQ